MAKTISFSIFALIVGLCVGLLCNFTFLTPGSSVQANGSPATVNGTPLPAKNSETPLATILPTSSAAPPKLDTEDNTVLLNRATAVITALRDHDYVTLATMVHPVDGVVFTPYSTVDLEANLRFSAAQIAALDGDSQTYVWGFTDGKGDEIELTISDYLARYVYNANFANAPILGIDEVMGTGNALENVAEVFPDGRFVEYYFPGLNPDHNGFDWCGLKLVFSVYDGEYKLAALIHSEWTI